MEQTTELRTQSNNIINFIEMAYLQNFKGEEEQKNLQ